MSQFVWFAGWVAVTGFGLALSPDASGHGTHQHLGLPPCPSVLLFNRPCPGCGLTTSWTALLHGDLAFAFHAHALGPFLYLLYTVTAWGSLWMGLKHLRTNPYDRRLDRAMWIGATIFLAYGLGRMVMTPHYQTEREAMFARVVTGR